MSDPPKTSQSPAPSPLSEPASEPVKVVSSKPVTLPPTTKASVAQSLPATVPGALELDLDRLDFDKGNGLVAVVAQCTATRAVLMVAYADREALELTLKTGEMHFRSRTRGLWKKGETSGNVLRVRRLSSDCDDDTILAEVDPAGPACHTGTTTCFGDPQVDPIVVLEQTIRERAEQKDDLAARPSYTKRLLADRNLRLKKIGEESTELVLAIADGDRTRAAEEAADVVYHMLVALHAAQIPFDDVRAVLRNRHR
jgi:phosphoribosyl-ATP pyrophosphohydrolase/phosphoribosyl-AMP cyclohydrolase